MPCLKEEAKRELEKRRRAEKEKEDARRKGPPPVFFKEKRVACDNTKNWTKGKGGTVWRKNETQTWGKKKSHLGRGGPSHGRCGGEGLPIFDKGQDILQKDSFSHSDMGNAGSQGGFEEGKYEKCTPPQPQRDC